MLGRPQRTRGIGAKGDPLLGGFETLLYEEQQGVATITLNRPEVLNAFNQRMQDELRELWRALRTNDGVRAVVLTGAGEKAFCSGIDRKESIEEGFLSRQQGGDGPGERGSKVGSVSTPYMFNDPGSDLNPKANGLWKPVVAAVNGMACGGALYMLGEADIIIAAEHATFFDPHVSYGMVAGFEPTHLLQKLPLGETLRVALLGVHERMSAQRAYQLGLVSEVAPAAELMERAMWIATRIASAPVLAVQGTLRAVWAANELSRSAALAQVSSLVSLGTQAENIEQGQQAFRGARPEWRLR
jgi:enoyl-CoA hydratase/carnithine racemase